MYITEHNLIIFQLESEEDQKLARILQHQRLHQLSVEDRVSVSHSVGSAIVGSPQGRPKTPSSRPHTPSNRSHTPTSGSSRPHTPGSRTDRPHTPGNRPITPKDIARPHTPGRDRVQTKQQKDSPQSGNDYS